MTIQELLDAYAVSGERTSEVRAMLVSCEQRTAKSGSVYDVVRLSDQTAAIQARDFRRCVRAVGSPQFLLVTLKIEDFRGSASAVVESAQPLDEPGLDPEDFSTYDRAANQRHRARLRDLIDSMDETSPYRALTETCLHGEDFEAFCSWTAAVSNHHSGRGGLLEHSLEVLHYAQVLAEADQDPYDADLLVAGALLHDIGKLDEYVAPPGTQISQGGQLAYHLAYGAMRVGMAAQRARDLGHDVPDLAIYRLVHIIEQSHGAYRLDQSRGPVGKEARVIAIADDYSAKRVQDERERALLADIRESPTGT